MGVGDHTGQSAGLPGCVFGRLDIQELLVIVAVIGVEGSGGAAVEPGLVNHQVREQCG